jgi:ABC-type sugar transport system ATPase subunit
MSAQRGALGVWRGGWGDLGDGGLAALAGPTGCDKSTLLRATAGLEISAAGEIHFGDRVAIHVPANQRDGAMSGARKKAMPRG